ncbi:MAG: RodZ domain-containing protein [Chloroflexota bacterium]
MDAQALGRYLRESRETKEITLEEAEHALKIRRRILESFELGQFTFSDATNVQTRGFVRNYARFLGLDDDRVVTYYESALEEATNPRRKRSTRASQTTNQVPMAPRKITDTNPSLPAVPSMLDRPARRNSFLNSLVMFLLAIASVAVIIFVVAQLLGQARPAQDTVDTNILGQLPASPTFTLVPSPSAVPVPTQVIILQPAYTGKGVVVTIALNQRTWLRVLVDGQQKFAGLARPGDQLPDFVGNDNIVVTAANAEALKVIYNSKEQPIFGGRGQQVDVTFTLTNVQVSSGPGFEPTSEFTATVPPTSAIDVGATIAALTPSATPGPSPTATDTPLPTATFTASPTVPPSPTVQPTPTITYTPSLTFTPSVTPSLTLTPTITQTPSPTAILPPRVTQEGLPATKPAG